MLEKYEIAKGFYRGFNYKTFFSAPKENKMPIMIAACSTY
jgi:hypothetical protein